MKPLERKNVTVETASNEIGVSKVHIYTLIKSGFLKAIDISVSGKGGPQSLRISLESIREFIKKRTVNPEKYFE